jgi:carboxyl-terminal processing protease
MKSPLMIFLSLFLFSCSSVVPNGFYLSQGYGLAIDIRHGRVLTYQVAGEKLVRLPILNGRINKEILKSVVDDYYIEISKDELAFFNYRGDLVAVFSPASKERYSIAPNTPTANIDFFFETFRENYPFFELYNIDWDEQYRRLSPLIHDQMTPPEIEGMLKEMVAPLNDDHVEIELTESYSPHLGPPEWWVAGKARDYVKLIEDKYVQLSYSSDRLIRHGSLTDDTGYILLAGMGGVLNQAQAAEIARRQFSAAITDFSEKKNLVIDLRFNRGGYDVVGLEFASFFTNEYRTAYHREVMNGGDFVPIQSVYVQPGEQFFNGEVYLLTSGATVSAAETFILAMQSVTTPIVIGEQTAGFFSDSLPRRLPNGVEFSLSHVRYYDLEGTLREGVPVIPDHYLPMGSFEKDSHLERALEIIGSQD